MIQLKNISRHYQLGDQAVYALKNISLTIKKGEFVAILGPSGCGKSSLLYVLGLLDQPSAGEYFFDGERIHFENTSRLTDIRGHRIGFIFQQFNLIPRFTAEDNAALPTLYREGALNKPRAQELLKSLGMGERLHHQPNQLSGGQQQRVAIARSLMNRPSILLADEPTGALDSKSSAEVMDILKKLHREGTTIIIITHDREVAQHAQRIIQMKDGQIEADETTIYSSGITSTSNSSQTGASSHALKMSVVKFINFALQGMSVLLANKVRSALSILGILIGVTAVVAMLAVGSGARNAIKQELAGMGSNLLVVRKGSATRMSSAAAAGSLSVRFSAEDAQTIKQQIAGIVDAAPNINGQAQTEYLNKNWNTTIQGVDISYPSMRSSNPKSGRFFTPEELKQKARVALIGKTAQANLFGSEDPLGKWIRINKVSFQIIGTLPEKGANNFRDQDDMIVIPYTTAQYRVFGKSYVDFFDVQVESPEKMEEAKQSIENLLIQRHRIPPAMRQGAIMVHNMTELQNALSETTKIISLLLSIVAAIALVVGGIGIMNIMLVTVTERTREIGLRKAIGARDQDILFQFLIESILLSVLGGTIGLLLGIGLTWAIGQFAGWTTALSANAILLPVFFSTFVGIFFGLYPAWKASKLSPLQALRYE